MKNPVGRPRSAVRRTRATVTLPLRLLVEAKHVMGNNSMSGYIAECLESDLRRRRIERFRRIRRSGRVLGRVTLLIPTDDIPLWNWDGWGPVALDDTNGTAAIEKDFLTNDEAILQLQQIVLLKNN